jgi:hypothetical protein
MLAASAAAQEPPPYSLPWLLRPATAGSVVRLDTSVGFFHDAEGRNGTTLVESVFATYRATPTLVPLVRVSFVRSDPPAGGNGGGFSNGLLGLNYVKSFNGSGRFGLFGAATLPFGAGGGDDPEKADADAMSAAIPVRSAMDNALFAVNYFTVIGGATLAHVSHGGTLQAELTVLQLFRARGAETQDETRTNFTAGLHAGRFFGRRVSLGAELRLQRWLTDAAPVRNDPEARQSVSVGVGPRFHFKLGRHWLRPGLAWTHALDAPYSEQGYDVLALDVPVSF